MKPRLAWVDLIFDISLTHEGTLLMRATCRGCATLMLLGSLYMPAQAQVLTTTKVCVDWGPTSVGSAPFNVALPKFNPALGTLLKVILELESTTDSGSIDWDNEAGAPSDIDLGIGAEVTASGPGALTLIAVPLQQGSSTVTADSDGAADYLGSDAFSVVGGSGTDDDSDELTGGGVTSYIASFFGETFDVNIATAVETTLSTSGGFGPINPVPGQAYGEVCVTYEYEAAPIPEPSTIALALGSAAAMLFVRRRRS